MSKSLTPLFLMGTSLQEVAVAEVFPSLPVVALHHSTLNPAIFNSLASVFIHPVNPLQRWSSPDILSLNPSFMHFSQIHSSFSSNVQNILVYHASPTPPLHSPLLLLSDPYEAGSANDMK